MSLAGALIGIRHRLEFFLAWLFFAVARLLPEALALRLGGFLGWLAYLALFGRRKVGVKNLRLAFPGLSEGERRRILRSACKNHGRMAVELARLSSLTDEQIRERVGYTPESRERYLDLSRRGKGVMYITGHICNWELLALSHSLYGYPMRLVARRLDNPFLEVWLNRWRTRGGNKVSERGKGGRRIRDMLGQLRDGGSIGLLVDQYARGSNGVLVPFFGKLAASHRGPATLALRTGAALLPSFLRRHPEKPGHYFIHFGPEVTIEPTGDNEKDSCALAARLQEVLEREIRLRPEDWFWLHCRWKNSPELPGFYGNLQKKWRQHRYKKSSSRSVENQAVPSREPE